MEINIIEVMNQIIKDLDNHEIDTALEWCKENQSKLTKLQNNFEFKLIQQKFIQLLKKNRSEAILYIKKHSKKYSSTQQSELDNMGMCIIVANKLNKYEKYKEYFDDKRWEELTKQFKSLCFDIYGISSNSGFSTTLRAGISCLKTVNCTKPSYQCPYKCPVCSPQINQIISKIPFTHRVTSSLICRITGDIMDEHNPPYVTKHNQIYSEKGIEKMKLEKQTTCPVTKQDINWNECKKIFLS